MNKKLQMYILKNQYHPQKSKPYAVGNPNPFDIKRNVNHF